MALKKKTPEQRENGFVNILTGAGTAKDKRKATKFIGTTEFTRDTANDYFRGEGISRKIITKKVDTMFKAPFETSFNKDLKKLKFNRRAKELFYWDRTYGGSVMIVSPGSGEEMKTPRTKTGEGIRYLRVFDLHDIQIPVGSIIDDGNSEYFGEPEFFNITTRSGTILEVHRSRCFPMYGAITPALKRHGTGHTWGDSVLSPIMDYIIRFFRAYDATDSILDDFSQTIIKMQNLAQLIANGKDDVVKKRLDILDLSRHTINSVLLDVEEEFAKHASSVAGLDKVIQEFYKGLAAVADMPVTVLMGESPAGMDATGESDITLWYDSVDEMRDEQLEPLISYLGTYFKGTEEEEVVFHPLNEPSMEQMVETRKKQAETDEKYFNMGVVTAQEIRNSRFGGDAYSIETEISGTSAPQLSDDDFPDPDDE